MHEVDQRLMQFYFSNLLKQIIKISANIGKKMNSVCTVKNIIESKTPGFLGIMIDYIRWVNWVGTLVKIK